MNANYYPSIDKVLRFFKLADADKLENRDVKPLIEVLQKIAYFSPRISGHILTRRTAIQSYDWTFLDEDSERAKALKLKLYNFINYIIYNYIDAVNFGIVAFTYNYELQDKWQIPIIQQKIKPSLLDYDDQNVYQFIPNENKYYPLPPANTLHFIYNPFVRGGILRTILIPEILRNTTLTEWANLNKLLKGIITSIIDPDKLTNAKSLMQLNNEQIEANLKNIDTAIQNADQYNMLRTLNFAEIKTQSIADAQSGNSYKLFIDALNADIAIAYLGQANTTELPNHGGSRAALNVLNLIRADILYADLLNIKTKINEWLVQFYRINFDANAIDIPIKFDFIYDANEDIETNARTFEYISHISSVEVDANEFYAKLGLTRPANVPDIINIGMKSL